MNRTARLAPALVLSVAVIGSASAGSAVAAKMITGKDIKNNTVASADLKNGTVTSTDLKNRSVAGKDVRTGTLTEGTLAPGVKGKLNKPNVVGYQVVTATSDIPTAGQGQALVFCPAGTIAVTGGARWEDGVTETGAILQESYPGKAIGEFFAPLEAGDVATAWKVSGEHNNLETVGLTAYVICVDPS